MSSGQGEPSLSDQKNARSTRSGSWSLQESCPDSNSDNQPKPFSRLARRRAAAEPCRRGTLRERRRKQPSYARRREPFPQRSLSAFSSPWPCTDQLLTVGPRKGGRGIEGPCRTGVDVQLSVVKTRRRPSGGRRTHVLMAELSFNGETSVCSEGGEAGSLDWAGRREWKSSAD